MALEAVVFPQAHPSCAAKALSMGALSAPPGCSIDIADEFEGKAGGVPQEEAPHGVVGAAATWDAACTIAAATAEEQSVSTPPALAPERRGNKAAAPASRRKRPKAAKNQEEMESQRRNHIAVERNRRRQMNEYLAVLRSVMPPSYAQRGDQASIVAGAINFVKELEQTLQSLEAQKKRRAKRAEPPPFAGFFAFPQYTTGGVGAGDASDSSSASLSGGDHSQGAARRGVADIEVVVAESHANVKVLARRRPRQLLRMVVALQCLCLTVLHLNVTAAAADNLAFYTFSLKMEDECRLSSVDEIAAAVNEILAKVSDEGADGLLLSTA